MYTLAAILASLLNFHWCRFGGVREIRRDPRQALLRTIPVLVVVLALTALASTVVFRLALPMTLPSRVAIAVALVAPLGVLLGVPFPLGLRMAAKAEGLASLGLGINGFFTVIGSVAALILGMALGFRAVLGIAGCCYILALVAITFAQKAPAAKPQASAVPADEALRVQLLGFRTSALCNIVGKVREHRIVQFESAFRSIECAVASMNKLPRLFATPKMGTAGSGSPWINGVHRATE